jgi:ATP-dependent exoDNAse (exonuclease V) beta subunit
MTVHKAKGLEFPVVILADLTAKLCGPQGADRYTDPERRLCAQRLLWCAPWELLEAEAEEARADQEEALRVAYVAATRARDLLVVATIGEEEREGGWLSPLHDALYPPKERWRRAAVAPGCPQFGDTTVLNRPPDYPDEVSVVPGLHHPKAGAQPVVWFDPRALRLKAERAEGVENEQVLQGTAEQAAEGFRRYHEWKDARAAMVQAGSVPRYRTVLAERFGSAEEASGIVVETVTLPSPDGRPSGRKFGRLVHDILQRAERSGDAEGLAAIWGRRHGLGEADRSAAGEAARGALEWLEGAVPADTVRHRELPVMVRLEDGTLVDGRIDFAWNDGERWTVVDYKTDRREKRRVGQVQVYGLALQKSTGLPVRGVVLEV